MRNRMVLIEVYRGWEISFNKEKEEFTVFSDRYDKEEAKKSYSSAKTYIDEFLKANIKFVPIKMQTLSAIYNKDEIITLIGIRKDKRFVYTGVGSDKKIQLSEYSEKSYFEVNPKNDEIMEKLRDVNSKIKVLRAEEKLLEQSLIRRTATDIKNELFPNFE